jgi:hypothetical protein
VIRGGLVERVGLRVCPLGCVGGCKHATQKADGTVVPSPKCELMSGAPPKPGDLPLLLGNRTEVQLRGMVDYGTNADSDITHAALGELARRGAA